MNESEQVSPDSQEPVQVIPESKLIEARREKLANLRAQGQAFPNHFKREHYAQDLQSEYGQAEKENLDPKEIPVIVAGRIMTCRQMGKASFVTIQDMTGRIQLYLRKKQLFPVRKNDLPEGVYDQFKTWDLGDIVGVHGRLFKTKVGELSIYVTGIELLVKAVRPLPDKHHGLTDTEMRYRQRYVDLIVNKHSKKVFETRTKLIQRIREFLLKQRFTEVETPMMHPIPGGAAARPFETWHNALDMQLYLRIAPELYLKRLVVGGFERVFEINRNFRNEGLSTQHNPEFTMLEFYCAYADYEDLMNLSENLFKTLAVDVLGSTLVHYQGHDIDFGKSFEKLSVKNSLLKYNADLTDAILHDETKMRDYAKKIGAAVDTHMGLGKLWMSVFDATVERKLMDPTFITEYPVEVSPLARLNADDPFITDRFELFIVGREIANGFSELNDPDDQAARFKAQVDAKEAGDVEAMYFDKDYIRALEYGMPPTAGEGIGIDRLVMLFTDSPSIRDVVLFPHLRQER